MFGPKAGTLPMSGGGSGDMLSSEGPCKGAARVHLFSKHHGGFGSCQRETRRHWTLPGPLQLPQGSPLLVKGPAVAFVSLPKRAGRGPGSEEPLCAAILRLPSTFYLC